MKHTMDIVRVIIFIGAGIGLYCYIGSALASESVEQPPLVETMSAEISYSIWDAVNQLEDSWYIDKKPIKKSSLDDKKKIRQFLNL